MPSRRGLLSGSIAATAIVRSAGAQAPRRPLVAVLVASSQAGALGVNLRTARAIGIVLPPLLLARADEVID